MKEKRLKNKSGQLFIPSAQLRKRKGFTEVEIETDGEDFEEIASGEVDAKAQKEAEAKAKKEAAAKAKAEEDAKVKAEAEAKAKKAEEAKAAAAAAEGWEE